MSQQQINEYPEMYQHYLIGVATGLTHHAALIYAQGQIRQAIDISHLNVIN